MFYLKMFENTLNIIFSLFLTVLISQEVCPYGGKCYRTENKQHIEKYSHETKTEEEEKKTQVTFG